MVTRSRTTLIVAATALATVAGLLVTEVSAGAPDPFVPALSSQLESAPNGERARVKAADKTAGKAGRLQPRMKRKFIPFGHKRKMQMARYSDRHYGKRRYRLRNPRVIVEHYTDGPTMMSAWWTMANNSKNLGEYPGVCTHFIIGKSGRIYRIVPLQLRCRHTIGLNQTAIGIEHVGTSDRSVMARDAQRKASYRLTLWLIAKFDIRVRNVIGHAESLRSPLRHEKYKSWRCNNHTDFSHRTMERYRQVIRERAREHNLRTGGKPRWVKSNC